ncbi:MAG: alanine--tRNA ligase [Flavobacteriales bacterium]
MKSSQIRKEFLHFFKEKNHQIVSSSPMVVKDDPTLMFTNAGMNQFKDYFLGNAKPSQLRVTDTQKCLRVSGKHNDLEEVGYDTYHHTMFEMLGNWSFGDFFKEDAIRWAWQLLTEVYKIDKDKIYVSVFEGSKEDNLSRDNETAAIWEDLIDPNRIINGNKKDNFWEMGDIGPCGPCSEIHIDIRSDEERKKVDGKSLVNNDHPQVIEVWNLVFMQYNRKANGSLENLPAQHVDTGMGFERLCMVLQGVTSNYDTDIFQPIIAKIEALSSFSYGKEEKSDIAMRVIADHLRAISFSIADGQLPSNTGAGYVIRRILRRAIRYGFTFLNLKEPFICDLVDQLVSDMGAQFPELKSQHSLIEKVIREEEISFLKTLDKGIQKIENLKLDSSNVISGKVAFELYDTYGFPIDLSQLIAQEKGWAIDIDSFKELLEEQKNRSRKATTIEADDWVSIREDEQEEFVGYDTLKTELNIIKYRKVVFKGDTFYQLVFNLTPFYPEGGGQVGDKGFIEFDGVRTEIVDTKKENNLIIHFTETLPEKLDVTFVAEVNKDLRTDSANNHSATHLLHHCLREVLGDHVEQKGSLVNSDYLRFDFSHFSKLSDSEVQTIEQEVNNKIRANIALDEHRNLALAKAKQMGAMALFGEKYGDTVRVIKFGDSIELCAGTHVNHTGEIGLFKLTSEGAVASGIRRIEAITSSKALQFYEDQFQENKELKLLIKNNNLLKGVHQLMDENQKLKKQIEKLSSQKAGDLKLDLLQKVVDINGVNFIGSEIELDNKSIKNLAFELTKKDEKLVLVLATKESEKVTLTVAISKGLVEQKGLHAGNIIREISKEINGGGGGQAFFATAGGKNPSGIESALKKAADFLV